MAPATGRSWRDPGAAILDLTRTDGRTAAELLLPRFDPTSGIGGRASIEVSPESRRNHATIARAKHIWIWSTRRTSTPDPATKAGVPAVTAARARGIPVKVTGDLSLES